MPGVAGTRRGGRVRPGCRWCRRGRRTRTRRRVGGGRRRTARRSWARSTTSSETSPRSRATWRAKCVHRGVDGVGRLGSGAHGVDVGLVDAEGAEDGGVERHAVGVVDGDSDGDAGDLAVDRRERRVATARRSASKAASSVGLAAVTAARLGTKPMSAAMPSSSGRDSARGCFSGEDVRFMVTIIRASTGRVGHSLGGKRRPPGCGRSVAGMSAPVTWSEAASVIWCATGGGCGR